MSAAVIDAHQHLWDPRLRAYPWMTDDVAVLRRPYLAPDLAEATAGAGVDGTVVVQADMSVEETEWLLAIAADDPVVLGVVGWVDLTAGPAAVREEVDRLRALPGRLVGVRHLAHDEPDAGWLGRPDVVAGVRVLAEAGLPFDLLIREREWPAAIALVEAVPEGRFVLDHAGKPDGDPAREDDWRRRLAALAAHETVACKASGLLTETGDPDRAAAAMRVVVDTFGPGRTLFGTDWPVSTLAEPYEQVVAHARAAFEDLSPADRADVLGGTATRVYGLSVAR